MTNADIDPPAIESILSLLRSNQDERKLAGLLLVTRVVIGQKCTVDILARLADAVGSSFLRRLLRSTDIDGVYADLAINIIAAFMSSPDIAKQYAHDDLCRQIVAVRGGVPSGDLLNLYTSFINAGDPTPLSLLRSILSSGDDDTFRSVVSAWIRPEYARQILFGSNSVMLALAADLQSRQDMRKFAALEFVVSILSQLHPFQEALGDGDERDECSWPGAVRDGLLEILSSRVNAQQRRLALLASWFMLDLFGYSWASSSGESISDRFPTLLVTTVAIETRVLLECHAESPVGDDDVETLRTCMIVTNMAIAFLVEDDSAFDAWKRRSSCHWSLLPPESLLIIQSRLTDIIRVVFGFLVGCESQERVSDPVLPQALRVLGTWISEDSESFQSDLESSCAFLIRLCRESNDDVEPFVYLLPAFERLSVDALGAERLVENHLLDEAARLISSLARRPDESTGLIAGDVCHILVNVIECLPSVTTEPVVQKMLPPLMSLFKGLWERPGNIVACLQIVCVLLSIGRDSLTPTAVDKDGAGIWGDVVALLFNYTVDDPELSDLRQVTLRRLTSCTSRYALLADAIRTSPYSLPASIQSVL